MDPELLPVSRSGIIVPDPDPAKSKRASKYNYEMNSGLYMYYWTVVLNTGREWQIVVKILLFD